MSDLFLIRHGQASFGKLNYDELSELGHAQARKLGHYFKQRNQVPERIIIGALNRHRQTAEAMLQGMDCAITLETEPAWNEFDFQALVLRYLEQFPPKNAPGPLQARDYFAILRKALLAWSQNEIVGTLPETWDEFEARVGSALSTLQQSSSQAKTKALAQTPTMVVSSGGAIAMALKHILHYPNQSLIDMNLQSLNTGISQCYISAKHMYLRGFNAVPHLDQPNLQHMVTFA